jgi:hypothetical protein
MPLPDDLKRLARDAFNDISSTYQAVLTQNTGWVNTSLFNREAEQQVSTDLARKAVEEPAREVPDMTPSRE